MKTMSHDKSSGSVLGPQGGLDRLFNAEEMKKDLAFAEKMMFPSKEVALEGNKKETDKKCIVCGGAIVEDVWYESSVMTRVGSHDRGYRRSMRYCQNCEILYK